jgi:hypothetical protein
MRPCRLTSVALAVVCVAVSTVGVRFTDRDQNMEIIRGRVGQSVHVRGGEVEVTDVARLAEQQPARLLARSRRQV